MRPLIGAILMYFVVGMVLVLGSSGFEKLIFGILSGAVFYTIWSILSWILANKPDGLEKTISQFIFKK